MYYILVETEQELTAWIDDMDLGKPEEDSVEQENKEPATATFSSSPAPSSAPIHHYGEHQDLESADPSLEPSSSTTIATSSRPAVKATSSATVTAAPKKRSTFNVLEAMAGPSTPLPAVKKQLAFATGNPSVETINGIIHLYTEHPTGLSSAASKSSRMVCIVAVPTWLSLSDLMAFFGREFLDTMEGLRVLSDSSPNKYMIVLKFGESAEAVSFVKEFHGKRFSMLSDSESPELCQCAFVKYVDFVKPTGKSKQESPSSSTLFPYGSLSGPTLIEVPNCPVCLERLDPSVSGLLTILCNHTFHCTCLMQWKEDNNCPVCRFTQQPVGHESLCAKCGKHEGLWICLLCGHVGCSRYLESHAYTHYKETFHNYALELSSQRVWDYAGDGYVHRLIQNKSDGKLVELPAQNSHSNSRSDHMDDKEELQKSDAIYLEYQYLLTAQLETQRSWYEQKMREIDEIRTRQMRELEEQQKGLKDQLVKSAQRNRELEQDSKTLINVQFEKEKTIRDLEEQVRDLMVFLEAQKTIAREDGDLTDGSVLYLSNPEARIAAASSSSLPNTPAREALRRKLAGKKKK